MVQAQHLESSLLSLSAQTPRTGMTRSLHVPTQALGWSVSLRGRQLPLRWISVVSWAHGQVPSQHWEFVVLDLWSLHLPNATFPLLSDHLLQIKNTGCPIKCEFQIIFQFKYVPCNT